MSSTEREILRHVEHCLSYAELGPSTPVLAGCSGGPDSTALVLLLDKLRRRHGYPLAVAHYNHNLRGEDQAALEVATVRTLCRSLKLELLTGEAAPGQIQSASRGRSLEDVARDFRREFLAKTAKSIGCRHVALGHTLDDQIETLVMRFFQGSGWRGLRGMGPVTGLFLRPMLHVDRAAILEYLSRESQTFYSDPTNNDLRFLRNRVRKSLLPILGEIFPGHGHTLQVLSRKMSDLVALVEGHETEYLWQRVDGEYQIPLERFLALPRALRLEGLMQAWDQITLSADDKTRRRLPYRFVEPLLDGSLQEVSGHGVRIQTCGGYLALRRVIVSNDKKGYVVSLGEPRDCTVVTNALRIAMERLPNAPQNEAIGVSGSRAETPGVLERRDAGALLFAEGAVHPPLILRSRRAGDRLTTNGGTRSVKKIMIEVAGSIRERIPVLVDKKGVAAVLGAPFGFTNIGRRGLAGTPGEILFLLKIDERS